MSCPPPSTAPRALIYGPAGTRDVPYLPATAMAVTASESMWRSMTTADFAAYDLIVVGDNYAAVTAAQLQALFDTRAIWGPAVTGRVVISGFDASAHGSTPGAALLLRTSLAWVASGAGTGLHASTDLGSRHLDYLSPLGSIGGVGMNFDSVIVVTPTHPIVAGNTSATLSGWGNSVHNTIDGYPSTFTRIVNMANGAGAVLVARNSTLCER